MARIARGDEPAFRELVRRHVVPMVALARHITGNPADAEDIAQEALLRVWTNAPRWRPLASFRTWLTRVVVNLCLDRNRRAQPAPLAGAGDVADPAPSAIDRLQALETERVLAEAIAELPPRQRAAIVLSYREGLGNADAAAALETTVSALETLLVRAKQSLRKKLGDLIEK